MNRSFSFLVNPLSGGGTAGRVVVPLARRLREVGAEVEVTYTSSADEVPAAVAAAMATGAVLVAVGGDGMVSSVAGPASAAGAVLALVPAGRGNDFARQLGLPQDPDAQVELLLHGDPHPVDLLAVSVDGPETVVAGSVYSGVDARAGELVNQARWLPSKLQYPVSTVRALATYRPFDLDLEVDGVRTEHRAACVVVANSGYYGKGVHIAPDAAADDGELDVVVIEAAGRLELIRSLPKAYDGSHVQLDEVKVLRGKRVVVSGSYTGGAPVPVGADGEPLAPLRPGSPLTVEIRPGALQLLS